MSKDMLLLAAVRVSIFKHEMRKKAVKGVMALTLINPIMASAATDIAEMGDSAAVGAKSLQKSALTIAQFAGVVFVIGGLIAAKNKKDNPQIKTGHIIGSFLFGVCLVVIPEIIKRSQSQVGLTPVDVS